MIFAGIGIIDSVVPAVIPPVEQTFTTNGTWNCCAGAVCVEVIAVGAGAGGRSVSQAVSPPTLFKQYGGPGGGAGEVVVCTLTSGYSSSECVRIGAGGDSDTAGGSTCFGSLVTALGGALGTASSVSSDFGTYESIAGGDGGGTSSNGGNANAGGCIATAGQQIFSVCNQGSDGGAISAKPGGGAAGGSISQRTDGSAWTVRGLPGSGGAGSTICGICLGVGGGGGISAAGTGGNASGTNATCYGAGGGGAGAAGRNGSLANGGSGFNGVIKVIQYFS
jgi:hypothetical protein